MRFVVTAGPTREPIDPVRFLSNRSSGKMGYAIAAAAIAARHEVQLISGPVCLPAPAGAEFVSVTTSDEMFAAVHRAVADCDVLVMCAAVADYKPAQCAPRKLKKQDAPLTLELTPTKDILASLRHESRSFFVVGFAAETNDVEAHARKKLQAKNCDLIVANDVSRTASGMESDVNELVLFTRDGARKVIPRAEKKSGARDLVKIISELREKRLTKKS